MKTLVSQKPRFYELDLFRFLAAIAVMFFHYTFSNVTQVGSEPVYPMLKNTFKYGYLGVELFFIISGFVILLTATKKDWRGFIVSRISRLYPAFWVAVTLTALVILAFGGDKFNVTIPQYLLNLTMVSEYIGIENVDPVYWTLQVEIKFYFWVFLILVFKQIPYIERFIFAWLLISVMEIFHFKHSITHFILMPEWSPYFSAGALFYLIHTKGVTVKRMLLLLFAYAMSIYFAIEGAHDRVEVYNEHFSPLVVSIVVTAFYFLFTLLIFGKLAWLRFSWFITMGAISYPLYLIHGTIGEIIFQYEDKSINKYLFLFSVMLLMIFMSYLLHRYFESGFGKKLKVKLETLLRIRKQIAS